MSRLTPTVRPLLTKELLLLWSESDVSRALRGCTSTIAELAYEIGADAPGRRVS